MRTDGKVKPCLKKIWFN